MDIHDAAISLSSSPHLSSRSIVKFLNQNRDSFEKTGKFKFDEVLDRKSAILDSLKSEAHLRIKKICRRKNIKIVDFLHGTYPGLLKEIPDFPAILYILGNDRIAASDMAVAVVGSRRPSSYGLLQTTRIVKGVTPHATIVSGLALGIDAKAHQSCLEAGGKTVAVLGTPIDQIYPVSNEALAKKIIENDGAIISEYPPGFPVNKYNFPLRNRIIAGLSRATLVMEAAKGSGSLITAYLANTYNRDIFALPGNVDSGLSYGTNQLIREGANILLGADDVLGSLGIDRSERVKSTEACLTDGEKVIYLALKNRPLSFDKIQNLTRIDVAILSELLVGLEVKKLISRMISGEYVLLTE